MGNQSSRNHRDSKKVLTAPSNFAKSFSSSWRIISKKSKCLKLYSMIKLLVINFKRNRLPWLVSELPEKDTLYFSAKGHTTIHLDKGPLLKVFKSWPFPGSSDTGLVCTIYLSRLEFAIVLSFSIVDWIPSIRNSYLKWIRNSKWSYRGI